eukprot:CAMPEP_0184240040 /NCGR_PEP_ID=MMETSP0976-20121227/27690_1 /TAXON_ID=483370 /ORGANISM="non described non described, Strain CCMP2097" /LENGTH=35 /DNA_ID= /DNA_START= /DNA_END= /DNA_ORIENTATION=
MSSNAADATLRSMRATSPMPRRMLCDTERLASPSL